MKLLTLRQASDLIIQLTGKPYDRSRLYWRIITNRLTAVIQQDPVGAKKRYFIPEKTILDNIDLLTSPLKKTGRPLNSKNKRSKRLSESKEILKNGLTNFNNPTRGQK